MGAIVMNESRPDPDTLLAKVQAEDARALRGSLRIFFGYAAGVGKTFAMLTAAHQSAKHRDLIVGYVEPHARPETQALVSGLEQLPAKSVEYRGVTLTEFDVDAALKRHPELILVDEPAHTNAAGTRHEKRCQDIEELLDAGIDVWTTLNVQHIESLNDVIGQIVGITVRETLPDRVFDLATELELVDITPDELVERLHAGKIYLPDQARRAVQSFFQKSNLSVLRELSLRQAANRVHTDVETARQQQSSQRPWATTDRLLVCVGPSPTTARVIRTAKRMAAALNASWVAVAVDLTGKQPSHADRDQIASHFRLAERLGAEVVTVPGAHVTTALLDYARSRNATKILIGKTRQPRWRRLIKRTVVDELLDQSGDIDVYVIQGSEDAAERSARSLPIVSVSYQPYLMSTVFVGLAGLAAVCNRWFRFADREANTIMIFLAAVAFTAYRYGRGPAVLASLLAVLAFDFFFITPILTFAVADTQYLVTFVIMLSIGVLISTLTSRLKQQVDRTRLREMRTNAMYELGKKLSSLYGQTFLIEAAGHKLAELVGGEVTIYLQTSTEVPEVVFGNETSITAHPVSLPAAQWVIKHDQIAGAQTNTLPNAVALFLPLVGSHYSLGAIAIRTERIEQLLEPDQRRFIDACASQLALALERDRLAIDAAEARIAAESEEMRSSLLSSVSHDLKTPLAAISGASTSILNAPSMDQTTRNQLLETITEESNRLNRLLENILQMSKLEAGAVRPNQQWHLLEEIIGSALHRTSALLAEHPVTIQSTELPLLMVDGLLLEQLFVNLLENVARHTPAGTAVVIQTAIDGDWVRVSVSDHGPGLPSGTTEKVFEKFYRASARSDAGRGSGLGLAICRAIAKAHGGQLTAANRPSGGAEFVLRLPLPLDAPQVVLE